jgi:hypothetical protein
VRVVEGNDVRDVVHVRWYGREGRQVFLNVHFEVGVQYNLS